MACLETFRASLSDSVGYKVGALILVLAVVMGGFLAAGNEESLSLRRFLLGGNLFVNLV